VIVVVTALCWVNSFWIWPGRDLVFVDSRTSRPFQWPSGCVACDVFETELSESLFCYKL
jgi:hypothetical protein